MEDSYNATNIIQALIRSITGFEPKKFEELVLVLMTLDGSQGELTPASGDDGIDVRVTTDRGLVVAQCKAYSEKNSVSPREIREFLGAVIHAKAMEGYFFTTSTFTDQALAFSNKNPVLKLVDRQGLASMILTAISKKDTKSDTALRSQFDAAIGRTSEVDVLKLKLAKAEDQIRSLHEEVGRSEAKCQASVKAAEKKFEELNKKVIAFAIDDARREADYLAKNANEYAGAYAAAGIPINDAIAFMRGHVNANWISGYNEKYPIHKYIYLSGEVNKGHVFYMLLIIDRLTHRPVEFKEQLSCIV